MKTYTCNTCGNVLEVRNDGNSVPVCCGKSMEVKDEKDDTSKSCGCEIKR